MIERMDVGGLTEAQVRLVQELAAFLRTKTQPQQGESPTNGKEILFLEYPLGVKGEPTRTEIYDYL